MPVQHGKDDNGTFYRWGRAGKKYYYKANNAESRRQARQKAERQGRAIRSGGSY